MPSVPGWGGLQISRCRGLEWACAGAGQGEGHCHSHSGLPRAILAHGRLERVRHKGKAGKAFRDAGRHHPQTTSAPFGERAKGPGLGSVSAALQTGRRPRPSGLPPVRGHVNGVNDGVYLERAGKGNETLNAEWPAGARRFLACFLRAPSPVGSGGDSPFYSWGREDRTKQFHS